MVFTKATPAFHLVHVYIYIYEKSIVGETQQVSRIGNQQRTKKEESNSNPLLWQV